MAKAKVKVKLPTINRTGPGGSWPTKKQYWRTSGAVLTAHSPAERGEMFTDEDHPNLGVPRDRIRVGRDPIRRRWRGEEGRLMPGPTWPPYPHLPPGLNQPWDASGRGG